MQEQQQRLEIEVRHQIEIRFLADIVGSEYRLERVVDGVAGE